MDEDEIEAAALEIAQRYIDLADEVFERARQHVVLALGLCAFSLVLMVMS